ncbi:MAG: IS66 family transposase, partial [Burkholderiaceae bacterium]|nr:IS66 family transposase [Burkholderiaceae bacterium]
FGGSCHTVLYDRMRTVVAGLVEDGSRARLNERFAAFADHWGFAVRLCCPYRAKTKGKVESGVKYVKGNFIPGRSFTDLEVLRQVLMTRPVLHADETPVAMLAPGKGKTHKAYIWSYGTTEFDPIKAVLYDFAEGRSGKHARRVLKGWTGTLVCDDYAGYKALFQNTVTEAGCMAHARRKFHDLWANHQSTLAKEALDLFGALYDVERIARELDADQRHRLRQLRSKPITDTMHEWLTLHRRRATDGTAIAKAIDYSLGRWVALTRFLDDGALPIDNNWIENRIRPIALGRSNWLFAGSLRGGQRAAAAMSLIQSAKLNGLDPYRYLRDVLERLPTHPNSRIEELLPHRWTSATAEH